MGEAMPSRELSTLENVAIFQRQPNPERRKENDLFSIFFHRGCAFSILTLVSRLAEFSRINAITLECKSALRGKKENILTMKVLYFLLVTIFYFSTSFLKVCIFCPEFYMNFTWEFKRKFLKLLLNKITLKNS